MIACWAADLDGSLQVGTQCELTRKRVICDVFGGLPGNLAFAMLTFQRVMLFCSRVTKNLC